MTRNSIPKASQCGILHLPEALEQHPNNRLVSYCRVSEFAQVYSRSLDRQKATEGRELQKLVGKLYGQVAGRERGKMSNDRPHLREAIRLARKFNAIVCARDLSRLIRAEAYDHVNNWHAQPTRDELERLLELADGVRLATRLDPDLRPEEIHSIATRSGGKPGRPSTVDDKLYQRVIFSLQDNQSYSSIARFYGISKSMVQRIAADMWKID